MTENSSKVYIENMARFSLELRKRGIIAGIAETCDAIRAAEIVGMADRTRLKYAMSAVYAKSQKEKALFSAAFDEFFVSEQERLDSRNVKQREEQELQERYDEATQELIYDGKPLELSDMAKQQYSRLPEERREELMRYLDFSMDNPRHSPFNARFMQRIIEQRMMLYGSVGDMGVEIQPEQATDLLRKNLSDITDEEIPAVISMIQSLVSRINGAISREYRRSGKSGQLDFRKTIHKSMKTGGSFHNLAFKERRRTKQRIVMLCDVSGSMVSFSHFAIRFIKAMSDVSGRAETFLFSEGFTKVSPFDLRDMDTFEKFVKSCGLWGKGTDLARALDELKAVRPTPLSSSTVLVILSDTRTVSVPAAEEKLRQIIPGLRNVLWLNPIPKERWSSMKSVSAFSQMTQMLDCSTLENLAKASAALRR